MSSHSVVVESVRRETHLHFLTDSVMRPRMTVYSIFTKCPPPYFESLCRRAAVYGCVPGHLSPVWAGLVNPLFPVKGTAWLITHRVRFQSSGATKAFICWLLLFKPWKSLPAQYSPGPFLLVNSKIYYTSVERFLGSLFWLYFNCSMLFIERHSTWWDFWLQQKPVT